MSGFDDYFRDVRSRLAAEAVTTSGPSNSDVRVPDTATTTATMPSRFPAGSMPALAVPPHDASPGHEAPLAPAVAPASEDALPRWRPVALEAELLAVLDAPAQYGETIEGTYTRKERELCAVCDRLTVADARVLFERLRLPAPDDPIVARLARWIERRRESVRTFLGDARRREAVRIVKRGRR